MCIRICISFLLFSIRVNYLKHIPLRVINLKAGTYVHIEILDVKVVFFGLCTFIWQIIIFFFVMLGQNLQRLIHVFADRLDVYVFSSI